MQTLAQLSLVVHIAAGSMALLSGLTAILSRKHLKIHRPSGKIYLASMWIIFGSSLYLSLLKQNYFLLFIGVFTLHSCLSGYRSLKLRNLHAGQKPQISDWIIEGFNLFACGALVILGLILTTHQNMQFAIICMAFGFLGIRLSYSNIKRFRGKFTNKLYWLLTHIGGMIGSYIGAITAFSVNNNRWMGLPHVVAWLAPTVLLVPFIYYEISRVKQSKSL